LRGELERLLAADGQAPGVLEQAVGAEVRSLGVAGKRVGSYLLVSEIGRGSSCGGIGPVWPPGRWWH
jgi:hypothetical protein